MVRVCAFPNCANKMSRNTSRSFHRLPLLDRDTRKLWLVVLQMDANTPVHTLRRADHRVCSDHFDRDDYCQSKRRRNPIPKHFFLKKNAVPRVERPAADRVEVKTEFDSILPLSEDAFPTSAEPVPPLQPETKDIASQYVNLHLQDNWTSMGKRLGHFRSKGIQVNLPRRDVSFNVNEMCPLNMERPTVQHIIDEKAILQLLEHCPKCNRKCRCTKHTRSPYFIVYQSCYFCEYRRKWANQPEARNIKILKQRGPKKKKLPALNESVNAEPQPSHLEKICVSKSPDSESNHQLQS
uniref:uncharacterized protein isoform X1 n=1 Tax=Centroberyx gerrardi TaxID=166262 RepID=UPI003AAC206B